MKNAVFIVFAFAVCNAPDRASAQEAPNDTTDQKIFDSPNVARLVEETPFIADRPIAREIRYIYSSVIELTKHTEKPYTVTNEDPSFKKVVTPGTTWNDIPNNQLEAISQSDRQWIARNESHWSESELRNYLSFQRSMESSIALLGAYTSAMNALAAVANTLTTNEALKLCSWADSTTHCIGPSAPEGSILHLEMLRVTKGKRFGFYSTNNLVVIATLETGDGRMVTSSASMQMWRNTNKTIVSSPDALPNFLLTCPKDVYDLLGPLKANNFMMRDALLINAAIEDLYLRMVALGD